MVLQDTLNPISAAERVKINTNWDEIRRGFSSLQNQINILGGGAEVDKIVERIDRTLENVENASQAAIDNLNNNYAEKLVEINQSLNDLSTALTNAVDATTQANNATASALLAIQEIQNTITNFSPRGPFVLGTQYYKGNIVSNNQGSSYIAIKDNINSPLDTNADWALLASIGPKGDKGDTGRGFEVKGYFPSLTQLENTIMSPEAGDAYGVGASMPYDIYIYDGVNNTWVDNGALQGAKGDPGSDANVTSANIANALGYTPANVMNLNGLQSRLDSHLSEMVSETQFTMRTTNLTGVQMFSTLRKPKFIEIRAWVNNTKKISLGDWSSGGSPRSVYANAMGDWSDGGFNTVLLEETGLNFFAGTVQNVTNQSFEILWSINGTVPTEDLNLIVNIIYHGDDE